MQYLLNEVNPESCQELSGFTSMFSIQRLYARAAPMAVQYSEYLGVWKRTL